MSRVLRAFTNSALSSALSFVQALPPGVYVAMNGRCFAWDDVVKNRERGIFEPRR